MKDSLIDQPDTTHLLDASLFQVIRAVAVDDDYAGSDGGDLHVGGGATTSWTADLATTA